MVETPRLQAKKRLAMSTNVDEPSLRKNETPIRAFRLSQEYRHVSPSALTVGFEPTSHESLAFEASVVLFHEKRFHFKNLCENLSHS